MTAKNDISRLTLADVTAFVNAHERLDAMYARLLGTRLSPLVEVPSVSMLRKIATITHGSIKPISDGMWVRYKDVMFVYYRQHDLDYEEGCDGA